jgi:hypothetical protein
MNEIGTKVRMIVHELRAKRSAGDSQLWLWMLVDAMEDAARAEHSALPCSQATLSAFAAKLALPVRSCPEGTTAFSGN